MCLDSGTLLNHAVFNNLSYWCAKKGLKLCLGFTDSTLMLRKCGWSARTPVSKTAILTFAPVKPLAHSFSASNMDVICDLCFTCQTTQTFKNVNENQHLLACLLAAHAYHVDASKLVQRTGSCIELLWHACAFNTSYPIPRYLVNRFHSQLNKQKNISLIHHIITEHLADVFCLSNLFLISGHIVIHWQSQTVWSEDHSMMCKCLYALAQHTTQRLETRVSKHTLLFNFPAPRTTHNLCSGHL